MKLPHWMYVAWGIDDPNEPKTRNPIGFVPQYEPQQFVYVPGYPQPIPIDRQDLVTADTADWLLKKYGGPGATVELIPFGGIGGPVSGTAEEHWITWPQAPGQIAASMNAAVLAKAYSNNPEQDFPGLAEKLCWAMIAVRRSA